MTSAGWGRDAWGTTPWGGSAIGTGIHVVSAVALSTREVLVTLSGAAMDIAPTAPGDALNPDTWTIQRLDTFDFLHVVLVSPTSPSAYVLTIVEEFGPVTATHRASSSTLLDATGALLVNPRNADFAGIIADTKATQAAQIAERRAIQSDIANPQTPGPNGGFISALVMDSSGDYMLESGNDLVKKLIVRRLMSSPGDFFHLPDYGIGFKVKEPVPVSDLTKLQAEVELQVHKEPEVQDVRAVLSVTAQAGDNVVMIRLKVKTRSGNPLDIELPMPLVVAF
jgi:hypothetical protein